MNAKVKSKKVIVCIFFFFIVAVCVAFFVFNSNTLASNEVFNDIDFESKYVDVDGYNWDYEKENILIKLKLSEDDKKTILKALENSKFEILSEESTFFDNNYRIDIVATLFNNRERFFNKVKGPNCRLKGIALFS